ncbi:MAG: nucleotide exchange factor GrpE [Bacteroidota bacterium]
MSKSPEEFATPSAEQNGQDHATEAAETPSTDAQGEQEIQAEQAAEEDTSVPVDIVTEEPATSADSLTPEDELTLLKAELVKTQEALVQSEDQYKRLNADFINFRRRKEKEMTDTIIFANQELMKQLLTIVDDFERSLQAMEKTDNVEALKNGIEGVDRNMKRILTKAGLEPIEAIGADFDPAIHEAIANIPVQEPEKDGKVIDEVEKGYKLKDKVIRFSKVVVGESGA